MPGMKTSDAAYADIRKEEGLRLKAYKDWAGVWTIGYGHTGTAKEGMAITKAMAEDLMVRDVAALETALNRCLKVAVPQHQFDALVVFGFNVGTGGVCSSTLVKKLNGGDVAGAALEFARWNKITDPVTGKKIPDPKGILQGRRAREMALFLGDKAGQVASVATNAIKKNPALWLLAIGAGVWFFSKTAPLRALT